jgi:hypothetical protein
VATDAVTIIPEPQSRRQLGDEGLLVLWRDGSEPGQTAAAWINPPPMTRADQPDRGPIAMREVAAQ